MHHQDFSGDPPGTGSRKTAYHFRRGSSGTSASGAGGAGGGGGGVGGGGDSDPQPGSPSPGLHHQQPPGQAAGAQVKKKSGFQITSVTSAQINVSGNNSLADDTESYDDMDESHTEDLSSSDMLDVSASRATDTGVPERSSSDETLNSLHGVDTPGLVSPNEPIHPHALPQGSQQHASMVNGTVHQHYYPQQPSQSHHHRSDSLGGGEASSQALPVAPLASNAGPSQTQRPPALDNIKAAQPSAPVGGVVAPDPGSLNVSNVSAAAPPSGPAGFDNTSGQVAPGPSAQPQHTQTQTATGSRFRVVKLDTNSEPFRKGRWTCTEYYEKEVPHPTATEAPKGAEVAAESEAGNTGIGTVQPPHTLQPYQPPSQDFTSPQAMQSPPQGLAQTTPLTYVSPQDVVGGAHLQKPVAPLPTATAQAGVSQLPPVIPQQLPYAVDPHQAQPQGGYPAPQLHTGVMAPGSVRQAGLYSAHCSLPDPGPASARHSGDVCDTRTRCPGTAAGQHHSAAAPPGSVAATHGTPYMPLTAVLQPLLTPGATFSQIPGGGSSIKTSQLEDAQKLLFQHQGLLGLPRFGVAAGGEGTAEAAGSLAHMGMSAEASAFMAAAAGLRTQHAEGEEDRLPHVNLRGAGRLGQRAQVRLDGGGVVVVVVVFV
ncbi:hypothetical protein L3Q82_000821 [Scortum barcoo]|uniref:Uncharacterized protein n=1 Tax=Scortum barcoo TaxID=214431 RepID=A0ACB8WDR3_9TELE|nr:hypothetical protein L3Q82_000821 [Scortum barcoo]